MTITLKRAATCAECGTALAVGTRANWYRNGSVYGYDCHQRKDGAHAGDGTRRTPRRRWENLGHYRSSLDPTGMYAADGECIGRMRCGCEDYPCCGH